MRAKLELSEVARKSVAYKPKLPGYLTLSDINKLGVIGARINKDG
ncbi:unnamed protein product [marine sediment metagenome]|uniref:Uncharacterized protein n=1 Tax=marine sediment metagenome TaxID=412755 RepID=X1NS93_9ZZZZ